MLPTLADKQRAMVARDRLQKAKTMRVTSKAGTDFSVELGEFPGMCQYGFADEPGHWDQYPGAFAFTFPNEGSANGVVVCDWGDIIYPFFTYIQEPITLTIENGFIREITGGVDAEEMRSFMERYQDPEVYAISHIGWGLSRTASWEAMGQYEKGQTEGQDGRAFYGNFLFSTGPNSVGGGLRTTPCHLDIPMQGCSLFLDDEPMVLEGIVVAAGQQA
jgi:2,5-dihydroxypyridine 5,6-dioxygenase